MLTVDDYGQIRRAHRDGMSVREIARTFHHSRDTIREILQNPQPRPYTRSKPPPVPVLGPFQAAIDAILAADEEAPAKQRHTAMQVYRRLRDEHHYPGSYDPVRRYVSRHRRDRRETFIPLAHDPGQRLEADFGHIHVDFPTGRRLVPVLVTAWSYSDYGFAMAMPSERTEAILAGLVEALAFFGCVPYEVWWDNPTTVVAKIFKGRERRPNHYYAALASHYAFEPLFCMPARGNEKPYVETRVRVLQQQWATPVPRVADLAALNRHLRVCCLAESARRVNGRSETIGERFAQDRAAALALPAYPFDACVLQAALVDKYQMVRFDCNRYSVPRVYAYQSVTVKGYIDRVEVSAQGQVVARHARSYEREQQVLEPLHYLAALGRRPAALDHAPVLKNWTLPESFGRLRAALEERLGARTGVRHYIRVLQLLAEHPLERVERAVVGELVRQPVQAERIMATVARLAEAESAAAAAARGEAVTSMCHAEAVTSTGQSSVTPLCQFEVPRPDLGRFDQLLGQGGSENESEPQHATVAQEQPQATASAGDACRVRQARP
jgi:transposase